MTLALIAALLATVVVVACVMRLADEVTTATWPGEAPLHLRDNRAHDLELTHLTRLVAARDPAALHAQLVAVVDPLLSTAAVMQGPAGTDPRAVLDPAVRRFLEAPPLGSADRYRRELAAVLTRIEAL
ncbi:MULTISPECIES: hypothetical protein [Nocardioides]|uniref:Uncharacterized protein n=1 Tax=Nocardioides vastitatis TaxID=2568655 RepID=A0ABW0ZJE9_9ACTN|nr:hypothetical protein [Nocardioides sp.]THI98003.1 hypothetical protein E7Z54_14180 [Nocardioides sp.]